MRYGYPNIPGIEQGLLEGLGRRDVRLGCAFADADTHTDATDDITCVGHHLARADEFIEHWRIENGNIELLASEHAFAHGRIDGEFGDDLDPGFTFEPCAQFRDCGATAIAAEHLQFGRIGASEALARREAEEPQRRKRIPDLHAVPPCVPTFWGTPCRGAVHRMRKATKRPWRRPVSSGFRAIRPGRRAFSNIRATLNMKSSPQ